MSGDRDWKIRVSEQARKDVSPEELARILTEVQTTLVTKGKEGLEALSSPVEPYPSDGLCPECAKPLINALKLDLEDGFADEFFCLAQDCQAAGVHFLNDDELWRRIAQVDDIERDNAAD